jgi:hypothetical protein
MTFHPEVRTGGGQPRCSAGEPLDQVQSCAPPAGGAATWGRAAARRTAVLACSRSGHRRSGPGGLHPRGRNPDRLAMESSRSPERWAVRGRRLGRTHPPTCKRTPATSRPLPTHKPTTPAASGTGAAGVVGLCPARHTRSTRRTTSGRPGVTPGRRGVCPRRPGTGRDGGTIGPQGLQARAHLQGCRDPVRPDRGR